MRKTTSEDKHMSPAATYVAETDCSSHLSTAFSTNPTNSPHPGSPSRRSDKGKDHGTKVQATGDSFHKQEKVPPPRTGGPHSKMTPWLLFVIIFASMTGLLMGYDLAVVSVVLKPVTEYYGVCGPNSMCPHKEVFVAMIAPGALLGSIVGGTMADMYGQNRAGGGRQEGG
eukprot:GHVS01070519.1.p1 GENE.GHVS01070519.1~~GHVS01070519.1.p1  ORF type:complete len:170 (-),score=27.39 GHVS01070519.1:204-713(-)